MKNCSFIIKDNEITQTELGLFVNKETFIPAVIQSITPHYHFTSYSTYSKEYEIKLVEAESHFPDRPLTLHYNPDCPQKFLSALDSYGIKSKFLLKDSIEIWNLIVNSKETGLLAETPLLTSDKSGWILFENSLYYITSQFAISKQRIMPMYRCSAPYAPLLYDKDLDPADAFQETMELINLDFSEVMPILVSQVLSFLQPIIETEKLYSIPGLFLSGPTSTGKTELALALGTLFGNPATKDLQNFIILQSRLKDFEQRQQYFSDTTFILDDARKSPAYSVCQSITSLIDRFGRSAFAKNGTRLIPIVTGEPQVLSGHLSSLRNRFIEIYLNPSEDKMTARKSLIKKAKDNPLPLRTCLLYFIQYICKYFGTERLSKKIMRIKEEFHSLFGEQTYRSHDNLFMHYLGLRLFLSYGKSLGCLNHEEHKKYIDNYKETLADIYQNNALYTDEGQVNMFIRFLCNAIESERLKVYTPEIQACYYPPSRGNDCDYLQIVKNSYGHFSIIDIAHGFSGVYIKNRAALPNYPSQSENLPVLVINASQFFEALSYESTIFKQAHGYDALPLKEGPLKKLLANNGLLYTESRYEKGYNNYICSYPHWINGQYSYEISCEKSFCINMASPYAKKLVGCIESLNYTNFPYECLYESANSPLRKYELNGFNNISSFRHCQN